MNFLYYLCLIVTLRITMQDRPGQRCLQAWHHLKNASMHFEAAVPKGTMLHALGSWGSAEGLPNPPNGNGDYKHSLLAIVPHFSSYSLYSSQWQPCHQAFISDLCAAFFFMEISSQGWPSLPCAVFAGAWSFFCRANAVAPEPVHTGTCCRIWD